MVPKFLYRLQFSCADLNKIISGIGSELDYKFWCWSRRDVKEADVKKYPITTSFVEDLELQDLIFNHPFTISYRFNGSHFQCNVDELWNDSWFNDSAASTSPCITNTSLPVNVRYRTDDNNL